MLLLLLSSPTGSLLAIRFWLVILLAFSLMPSAASASTGVPVGEPDQMHAGDADYGSHALRSSTGLELVWRLESHGSGCTHHRGRSEGSPDPYHLLSGSELVLADARLLVGPAAEDVDGAVPPLCENLPYFATAPPSSR